MFERQLGLRENPFLSGHQPKYVYPSREHQEALAHLRYGIQNREAFVLITGEVGTGKTTAVYDALGEWGERAVVALITNSALTRNELLEEICLRFGVATPGPMSKPQTLVQLEKLLTSVRERGELAILLLDEAQNLDRDLLEEIRLLSNLEVQGEKLLQIFLVGQPELEAKLAQPELRQLRQRIAIHYRISPLSASETAHYIHHRVAVAGGNAHELFPSDTCIEIFRVTNGIPREINIVAGQSLLNAFVEDARTVTGEHVRAVEKEIEFQSVLRENRPEAARAPAPIAPPVPEPVAEAAAPALPAWFDEVMARQKAPPPPPPPPVTQSPVAQSPMVQSPVAPREPEVEDEAPLPEAVAPPIRRPPLESVTRIPPLPRRDAMPATPEPVRAPEPARATEPARTAEPTPTPMAEVARREPPRPAPVEAAAPPRTPSVEAPREAVARSSATRDIDFISPRLRAKLETADEAPERAPSRGAPLLALATAIAVVVIGAILLLRFGPWSHPRASAVQPAQSVTPAPPPSVAATQPPATQTTPAPIAKPQTPAPKPATVAVNPAPSAAKPAPAPPTHAVATKPAPAPTHVAASKLPKTLAPIKAQHTAATEQVAAKMSAPSTRSTDTPKPSTGTSSSTSSAPTTGATPASTGAASAAPATAAPAAKAPAGNRFGIAVGTYLNPERANSERTSLSESTQLPARVVTAAEDSVATYRVVIGSFADRVAAERAASDLIRRGLVNEARVVALAKSE
ncbi:MAG: AAA family ATPase [Candidatus Eisenbacteria bacterium]|uniref:AAA family ATPase n=1 Tax=Eiseniibacteriota bacterium TaxID=2212470 RepID=A0A9D6LAX9_UNCEI|nr:AAA family ATPase [Candidatus Eisenbacteria bacterium]MBI3540220.1 AAA family ATPase [Candidatus Eisenbacteria bacterium]